LPSKFKASEKNLLSWPLVMNSNFSKTVRPYSARAFHSVPLRMELTCLNFQLSHTWWACIFLTWITQPLWPELKPFCSFL